MNGTSSVIGARGSQDGCDTVSLFSLPSYTNVSQSTGRNWLGRNAGFLSRLEEELQTMREAGTYKVERVIQGPQAGAVNVAGGSEPVLNFCANNYLGLSSHPSLVQAAQSTMSSHGFGLSSVRFICGTQDLHKELEAAISKFHGTEDTILFPSCFDANAGLFEACLGPEDAVISDALNHASIIDGIRLCKAQYNHLDTAHLEEILKECVAKGTRQRMIVTVFSMDGDIAPLRTREICDLADKYEAQVFVDECHATGFLGSSGRGTPELCGVAGQGLDRVDIINSTLGKALGGATGGYTTGPKALIDLLRNRARPYLFSNTLAPSVATLLPSQRDLGLQDFPPWKVFKMLSDESNSKELRGRLEANVKQFRSSMRAAGFKLSGHESCPIVPVMLGDARLASEMADEMLKRGIYAEHSGVIGFSYPVVPKGAARIRVQMSAAHTPRAQSSPNFAPEDPEW
ncbi:2-amino-3-ketobutyrate coenzyme A ligase, mitochondrial [Symbiodinium microadriaticum]|uniref:2-amino-3-ketobutyrate coenzyme A ligase, mitochondrial n=1 Tax=Symbiodinium microadriaticum TaxID=2951 RepID=A0A1Q9CQD6_SYMMI|nr:2-amino-3-ketobutyrate coenzyme A ligase, mitochondrial [Symbiodinium microadriaticum]